MNDKIDEKLSAFMDDEYHPDVIEHLKQEPEQRARWMRYHLIRDVLSGHTSTVPSSGFAERVSTALSNEPTILAPKPLHRRLQQGLKQVAGLGIAATVATVAVLTVQQNDVPGVPGSQAQIAAVTPVDSGYQTISSNESNHPLTSEVQSKLSSYLLNHNEYSVTAKMQGMLPYMRIVSVTPSERIVVRTDEK